METDPWPDRTVEDLQKEKERLIERYLELQDEIERLSRQSYGVCCDVEKINLVLRIKAEKTGAPRGRSETSFQGNGDRPLRRGALPGPDPQEDFHMPKP